MRLGTHRVPLEFGPLLEIHRWICEIELGRVSGGFPFRPEGALEISPGWSGAEPGVRQLPKWAALEGRWTRGL